MFLTRGYRKHLDHYFAYLEITTESLLMTIQRCPIDDRPSDRGDYIVKCESKDQTMLSIYHADMFPRYYFNWDCMDMEIFSWLRIRKLQNEIEIKLIMAAY